MVGKAKGGAMLQRRRLAAAAGGHKRLQSTLDIGSIHGCEVVFLKPRKWRERLAALSPQNRLPFALRLQSRRSNPLLEQ